MSTHPTYEVMICDALVSLAERKGSSNVAIFKFIKDKYKFDEETLKPQLKLALKRLSDKKKLVKVSLNRYRLSLGERKSLRATNAGAKSKVALKKKVRKVAKSPTKTSEPGKVKKIGTAAPETPKKSPKKDTKKEKITKLKKTSAKPKVKKVGEGKATKRTLKTQTIEASKTKSKAGVKARAETVATKGKAASAAIKTAKRKAPAAATTTASTVEK
jgi:histone H1/5